MNNFLVLDATKRMRNFLNLAQPLEVKYGYSRGVVSKLSHITYRNVSSDIRKGIGNQLISERAMFMITVQTRTVEQNLIYSSMIKYGTAGSVVSFISEDLRKDVTVENGWINTIILSMYNAATDSAGAFTAKEVESILQEIANNYVLVTSLYKDPFDTSIIDKFKVPEIEDRLYTFEELYEMKKVFYDQFILTITEH